VELLQASTPNSCKTAPMLVLNAILTPSNGSKLLALLSELSISLSSCMCTTGHLVDMTVGPFGFTAGHTVIEASFISAERTALRDLELNVSQMSHSFCLFRSLQFSFANNSKKLLLSAQCTIMKFKGRFDWKRHCALIPKT